MKNKYRFLCKVLIFMFILNVNQVYAQEKTVTGKVISDEDNAALPGVNVLLKGTSSGTVTDIEGNYNISVPENATLVFSFIGFQNQEVAIGNRSVIDVKMTSDVTSLSEVVVVGYGTQEKRDVTGAMSTISSKEFNAGVINSPEQLFQGKLAGVQVTQNSGEPGGAININIRGVSSIRSGNNPLYVVDGFPLDGRDASNLGIDFGLGNTPNRNPLNFINPDDIESIDILKDASATAIYGSRGANGVVLITTKKAKAGEKVFNINSYVGYSVLPRKIDLLSADNFVDAAVRAGAEASSVDYGSSTDWQDEIFQTALTHSHSLSFAKGTEENAYRISMSYLNQEGIVKTSNLERFTTRMNATQTLIKDRLTIDYQFTIGHTNDHYVPITNDAGFQGSLIGAALQANPTIPVRRDDGTLVQKGETYNGLGISNDFNNPVAMLELITTKGQTTRLLGNIGATLNILKGLDFRMNLGLDRSFSSTKINYDPRYKVTPTDERPGVAGIFDVNLGSYLIENFLTYKKEFGSTSLNLLGGYSFQEYSAQSHGFWVVDTEIPGGGSLGYNNVGFGVDFTGQQQFSSNQSNKLQSYFGRVNLGLKNNTYLATATIRTDGSSRFGSNNRYGVFPSLALAWRLSEEFFMPTFFDDFKLRIGWGRTGNQEFDNGTSQPRLNVQNGQLVQLTNANPNIKWEETTQWNLGLDFSLIRGRLSGTIDYFNKNTTDLLVQLRVPQPAFDQFAWQNLDASLLNTGFEFSLNGNIISTTDLTWDASANYTYFFVNEIQGLGSTFFNTGAINGQGLSGAYAQRIAEGQPLGAFYMMEYQGLSENGVAEYANDSRLTYVGSAQPDFIYGFTTNIRFKRFDFGIVFNGRGGNQVYNNTANALFSRGALLNGRNVSPDVANSNENPLNAPDVSTKFLENGSFLRLNNFSVGYTLTPEALGWINSARLYVSGQNVFIIDDYSGYDPEVNVDKSLDGIPSFGIDYTGFPKSRTFSVGISASF